MCGIAGKIYLDKTIVDRSSLKRMSSSLSHRGPDDEGIYINFDENLGLVNRRLAIQDLSPNGHMPMIFDDKYVITYNGEIYNFLLLRKKLEKFGYKFKSKTDTEVILALYDKYKTSCLSYLMVCLPLLSMTKQKTYCLRHEIE